MVINSRRIFYAWFTFVILCWRTYFPLGPFAFNEDSVTSTYIFGLPIWYFPILVSFAKSIPYKNFDYWLFLKLVHKPFCAPLLSICLFLLWFRYLWYLLILSILFMIFPYCCLSFLLNCVLFLYAFWCYLMSLLEILTWPGVILFSTTNVFLAQYKRTPTYFSNLTLNYMTRSTTFDF